MSNNTEKLVGTCIFHAEINPRGCLSEANDNVNLVYSDGKVKMVKYHQVIEHMISVEKEKTEKKEKIKIKATTTTTTVKPSTEPVTELPTTKTTFCKSFLYYQLHFFNQNI